MKNILGVSTINKIEKLYLYCMSLPHNGDYLVVGLLYNGIYSLSLIDIAQQNVIKTFKDIELRMLNSIAFSLNNKYLTTAAKNGKLFLINLQELY